MTDNPANPDSHSANQAKTQTQSKAEYDAAQHLTQIVAQHLTKNATQKMSQNLTQDKKNSADFDFASFSKTVITTLQDDIERVLTYANMPDPLQAACAYAMRGNGKRVRPLLVASSYRTVVESMTNAHTASLLSDACRRAMLAVELLHTYSLIHDDLPCMDDDDLRRGRPTCHIKFDEATAMLAGDVLQNLAFEVLTADIEGFEPIADGTSTALLKTFAPCARRMVMGQMLDLNAENKTISQAELEAIHRDKTGALIEAAVLMGGLCALAQAPQAQYKLLTANLDYAEQLAPLRAFASNIGLAFQVQDDILDVIGNTQELGKPAGSDEGLDKSTYVKLMGVDAAQEYAQSLFTSANSTLNKNIGRETPLQALADWLWARKK